MRLKAFADKLFSKIDGQSLAIFRMGFGAIMLWEVVGYFQTDWINEYWIAPKYNFPYGFFDWVTPWPGEGMYIHFIVLGILALFMMLGFMYRISAALFFIGFTYTFLLEQTRYLNHFYLVSLISFLMAIVPAHKSLSLDALLFPKKHDGKISWWHLELLKFQVGIVYFFGGVAKINPDWLTGNPLKTWLSWETDFPIIGQLFTQDWMIYFMAYSGLLLDLFAYPLLLFRKTRPIAFLALFMFHTMNDQLFTIGIFPWFMLFATAMYYAPNWPSQLAVFFKSDRKVKYVPIIIMLISCGITVLFRQAFSLIPFMVTAVAALLLSTSFVDLFSKKRILNTANIAAGTFTKNLKSKLAIGFIVVWCFFQIALPLRHFLIPGNVSWTEEGHMFAWHMKLRSKSGQVRFIVKNTQTSVRTTYDYHEELTELQISKMTRLPTLIHTYANHIADKLEKEKGVPYAVYVQAAASLNFRQSSKIIDPTVDLTKVKYKSMRHNEWILQLED